MRVRVKAIKAHAWLFAPFERFVFLDFDSRPCAADFAPRLFERLDGVDALLHNQWPRQAFLEDDKHLRIEHNSAIAVFDARRLNAQRALLLFVRAFELMKPRRDQPPLMVALRAVKGFRHHDLPPSVFCRRNASNVVSCDAGCLVVHKPQKYDPGHVVVGLGPYHTGQAFTEALAALKIVNTRICATVEDLSTATLGCRVLVGADVRRRYATVAEHWPRAKFVLTVSTDPCQRERDHVRDVKRLLDPSRLFVLDFNDAADNPDIFRDLCSFLEVWSSCKTPALTAIAQTWRRPAAGEDAQVSRRHAAEAAWCAAAPEPDPRS